MAPLLGETWAAMICFLRSYVTAGRLKFAAVAEPQRQSGGLRRDDLTTSIGEAHLCHLLTHICATEQ